MLTSLTTDYMKAILERLYQHDTLSRAEAHDLLLGIADKTYNDAQVASLLTVYRMRDIRVDELLGFRDALIERALPIDLSEFAALDIVGTGAMARTRSTYQPVPAL